MTPVAALTSRMRLLSVSAMNRSPRRPPQRRGIVKLGGGGRAAVAAIAAASVAGDGGDDARAGVDLADAVVAGVGDEQVAAGVHRNADGIVQLGGGGRPAVAAIARSSVAGDGGDDARGGVDLADAVVVGVGDEQVAAGVHRHAARDRSARRRWPGRRRRYSPRFRCRRRW